MRRRDSWIHNIGPGWISHLKWQVVFWFMLTSSAAGFMPFAVVGSVIEWSNLYRGRWDPSPERVNDSAILLACCLAGTTVSTGIHLWMVRASRIAWDRQVLGVRGAVWFSIAWTAFTVGAVSGLWVLLSAPR